MMHRSSTRLKIAEFSNHISCILCGGYYVDATTITECLHSFCRTCIVRYLETSKYCPVCEVQVHKTRPLHYIRTDKTLQDIVYKLVPGLFSNEMKRRREFYGSQPPESLKLSRDDEDRGESLDKRFIYPPEEIISLSVEYGYRRNETTDDHGETAEDMDESDPTRRYLRCPAAVTVMLLKKFIRMKYGVPNSHQVDLQYQDESLQDDYTLMDVAYIYSWRRSGPMRFFYRILARPPKRMKTHHISVTTDVKEDHPKPNEDAVMKEDNPTPSATSASAVNGRSEEKPISVSTDDNNNTRITTSLTAATDASREAVKDAASSASKSAKETASSASKSAKEAASSASKSAKEAASSASKSAKEAALSALKAAKEAASSVSKVSKQVASPVPKASKQFASAVPKAAKVAAFSVQKAAKEASSSASKAAKEASSSVSKAAKEASSSALKAAKEAASSASKAALSASKTASSCQKAANEAALSARKAAKEAAAVSSEDTSSSMDTEEVHSAVPTSKSSQKISNSDCSIGNALLPQPHSSHAPSNPTAALGLPSAPAAKEAPLPTASSDRPASSAKEKLLEKTDRAPKDQLKSLIVPLEVKDDSSVSMDLDRELDIGPLVIAEPEIVPKEASTDSKISRSPQGVGVRDKEDEAEGTDDGEVDSGRGSDISSRAEARSVDGDDDIGSPASSVRTPDLEKPSSLSVASPSSSSLPSPMTTQESNSSSSSSAASEPQKDDIGALDLSTCNRKRGLERAPPSRTRHVANPPVLDKHRQTNPCLPMPKHPSFKLLPAVLPHTSIYKKPEVGGRNFRCRGSTLTVINPDPNSCRPKIVIKNLDPRPEHSHSRHHHHHHHNHHHQRM